jgi:hypothetical protein
MYFALRAAALFKTRSCGFVPVCSPQLLLWEALSKRITLIHHHGKPTHIVNFQYVRSGDLAIQLLKEKCCSKRRIGIRYSVSGCARQEAEPKPTGRAKRRIYGGPQKAISNSDCKQLAALKSVVMNSVIKVFQYSLPHPLCDESW